MRTLVTFRSNAFNTGQDRDHFINPGNYGDDIARWMIERLRSKEAVVEKEPVQEDYGWIVNLRTDGAQHWVIFGNRPEEDGEGGEWVSWVEKKRGRLSALLGTRGSMPEEGAVRIIHEVLAAAPEITEVRWHYDQDFQAAQEDQWHPEP